MIELNEDEATELRERLRQSPEAQPAEETIAVSANASSSVTFAQQKKGTVFEVLDAWLEEGGAAPGDGPSGCESRFAPSLRRSGSTGARSA